MFMHKSAELKIDLNAKDTFGRTAFQLAGKKVAELMRNKAGHYNIDLTMIQFFNWSAKRA